MVLNTKIFSLIKKNNKGIYILILLSTTIQFIGLKRYNLSFFDYRYSFKCNSPDAFHTFLLLFPLFILLLAFIITIREKIQSIYTQLNIIRLCSRTKLFVAIWSKIFFLSFVYSITTTAYNYYISPISTDCLILFFIKSIFIAIALMQILLFLNSIFSFFGIGVTIVYLVFSVSQCEIISENPILKIVFFPSIMLSDLNIFAADFKNSFFTMFYLLLYVGLLSFALWRKIKKIDITEKTNDKPC